MKGTERSNNERYTCRYQRKDTGRADEIMRIKETENLTGENLKENNLKV
jgi:hypothetical protein